MKTRAAVLRNTSTRRPYGTTRPISVEEVELDDPKAGEVRVRVHAAGLCHSDLSVIDGTRVRPLPLVLGHEAAGVIEAVGPGVDALAEGDHVVFSFVASCGECATCLSGRPANCARGLAANSSGTLLGGGSRIRDRAGRVIAHFNGVSTFAERTVASTRSVVKIEPDVPLRVAALFGCAVLTGVGAVLNTAVVRPGQGVAIFGLGGVGLSAVMGAALAGAHPIVAVDLQPAKLELARSLGATATVDPRDSDMEATIRSMTDGGVDFAFEAVGSASVLAQAFAVTRRGGMTVTVGLPAPSAMLTIPALPITTEERRISGSYMGSSVPLRDIPRFIALFKAGRLPVDRLLSGTVDLAGLDQAFDRLADGEVVRQSLVFAA